MASTAANVDFDASANADEAGTQRHGAGGNTSDAATRQDGSRSEADSSNGLDVIR